MDWKAETMLGQLPSREPLLIKLSGQWEKTTPYELLQHYRFPRFLSIARLETTMGAQISKPDVSREAVSAAKELA